MKEIPVYQFKKVVTQTKVDDSDFEFLSKHKWRIHKLKYTSYARTTCHVSYGKTYTLYLHQLLMKPPEGFITDHIDRDGLNNQRSNLRLATRSQNKANQKKHWKGTSKYKGVSWCSRDKVWTVRIKCTSKTINLGNFKDEIEAAKAYDIAAISFFKEFANLNFKE